MKTNRTNSAIGLLLAAVMLFGTINVASASQQSEPSSDSANAFLISCDVFAAQPWRNGTQLYAGGYASCDTSFTGTFYWSLVYAAPGSGADPRVARWSYRDTNSNWDANNSASVYYCGGSVGYYSAVTIESDSGAILISDYGAISYIPYCYYD